MDLRRAMLAAALGTALAPLAAQAAPPVAVSAAPATLHIDVIGMAAPDYAVAAFTVNAVAESEEVARAALAVQQAELAETLGKFDVPASAITWAAPTAGQETMTCMDGMPCMTATGESVAVEMMPAGAVEAARATTVDSTDQNAEAVGLDEYGNTRVRVWVARSEGTAKVMQPSRMAEIASLLGARSQWNWGRTSYEFNDRAAARKAALADGVAQARARADAYAGATGFRVVRIAGVSNRGAPFSVSDILTMMMKFDGPNKDPAFMASEFVPVGIDFILAPK